MKRLSFLMFGLFTGCAVIPEKPPQTITGPKAVVEIDSKTLHDQSFRMYSRTARISAYSSKDSCPWEAENGVQNSYLFSTKINYDVPSVIVDVPVGETLYVTISDIYAGSGCNQVVSFIPQENAKYLIDVKVHHSAMNRCKA